MKGTNSFSGERAVLVVRVTPRSRKPGVNGVRDGVVAVAVVAPPDRGKATEEARQRIAEWLGIAPSRVTLAAGATSREKRFAIAGFSGSDLRKRVSEATPGGGGQIG